ncbi:MAG: T9SS type A sorting domain-containing protein, partial [Bacteroidota bacterium]
PFSGRNFYRLQQVDVDGRYSYSEVISIVPASTLKVYPNPADAALTLAGFVGGRVAVYDGLGRRVLSTTLAANGTLPVDQLISGRYLLRTNEGTMWVVISR